MLDGGVLREMASILGNRTQDAGSAFCLQCAQTRVADEMKQCICGPLLAWEAEAPALVRTHFDGEGLMMPRGAHVWAPAHHAGDGGSLRLAASWWVNVSGADGRMGRLGASQQCGRRHRAMLCHYSGQYGGHGVLTYALHGAETDALIAAPPHLTVC